MKYLSEEDIFVISKVIQKNLSYHEPSPNYIFEKDGFKQWSGVIERVKMEYYPSFFDKVTKLIVDINKGHFYSNGNKRLALVTALFFVEYNKFKIHRYSKKKYKEFLKKLFPIFKVYKDYSDFSGAEFAFYNLSIIIANSNEHGLTHDCLKSKVNEFLQFLLYK